MWPRPSRRSICTSTATLCSQGGIRPHAYCLPVAKRETAPAGAAQGGNIGQSRKYFLGTDSAPHAKSAKEMPAAVPGIFNAPFALESYAAVFDEEDALDKFEAFASENGPRFYGLPLNEVRHFETGSVAPETRTQWRLRLCTR